MNKHKQQAGFSTLEILIAVALSIMALSAVFILIFGSQSLAVDSQTAGEAQHKAQELLSMEESKGRVDFNTVNPVAAYADGVYTKSISVTAMDLVNQVKKVTATVTWKGDHNRTEQSVLSTLISNPVGAVNNDTCSSVLSGDWSNPTQTQYEFGRDIINDTSSGYPITDVASAGDKLYVTVNNSHGNNTDTFFVLNITDPSAPLTPSSLIWSLDNNAANKPGLNAVAVSGNYAYVANAFSSNFNTCTDAGGTNQSCGQLQVIDLNSKSVVYTLKMPGVLDTNGDDGIGQSIFYYQGVIYLGLTNSPTGPELFSIDVGGGGIGGSPTNPKFMRSYEVGNAVESILVKNGVLYFTSANANNVAVLSASTFSPLGSGYTPTALPDGSGANQGQSLALVGNNLYLGRTYGTNEFYILNNSSPSSLTKLGSQDIGAGNDTSINKILIRDYLAFLITQGQFQVWKIDDPSNITSYAPPLILPGGSGTAMSCRGNYIYVGSLPSNDKGFISVVSPGIPVDYKLINNTGDITVGQGSSKTVNISVTLNSGPTNNVTLTASGLPSGASASFSNNPCSPTCNNNVTISTSPTTPGGTYPVTISGPGGQSTVFNLTVVPPFDYTLSAIADPLNVVRGSNAVNTITVTMSAGALPQDVTLAATGMPSGVTASYNPSTKDCTPNASSPYTCTVDIAFNANASATTGNSIITVTGTSGSLSHATTFTLNVVPAFAYTISTPSNFTISRGGAVVQVTEIVTMTSPGAGPQAVTVTAPIPSGSGITISPSAVQTCTPSSTSPYTCQIIFNYSAPASASRGPYPGQVITSTPDNTVKSASFKITVN